MILSQNICLQLFTLSVNPNKNVIQLSQYGKLINNYNIEIPSELLCHNDK